MSEPPADWLDILRLPPGAVPLELELEGKITHAYTVNYPDHEPRASDPHYKDFNAYRRKTQATAQCAIGVRRGGDFSECAGGLELHHAVIEFSVQNAVCLEWLEKDYPGISNPDDIGAWVESAENLVWLCMWHHRGHGGVHCATHSDFTAEQYVRGLIT